MESPVTLFNGGTAPPLRLRHDVLVPLNIKNQFHDWEKELLGASMVNIHSKVIVLDPFGENPVVMTGSHNLGFKASNANDDNLVIVEGDAPLAAAYAINIIAIYQTYRWNSYVAELKFWLDQKPLAPAAATASTSPATLNAARQGRSVTPHATIPTGVKVRKKPAAERASVPAAASKTATTKKTKK